MPSAEIASSKPTYRYYSCVFASVIGPLTGVSLEIRPPILRGKTKSNRRVEPRCPWSSIDQSTNREVPAVLESEFAEDVGDMEFCRAFANVQLMRNLLVCEVPEKQLEHLTFPCCQ